MYSNRKSSVKRHIINQHDGDASLVPFIEYMVGRNSGLYSPPKQSVPPALHRFHLFPLSMPRNQNRAPISTMDIFVEEFIKEKAKLAAKKDMGMNL